MPPSPCQPCFGLACSPIGNLDNVVISVAAIIGHNYDRANNFADVLPLTLELWTSIYQSFYNLRRRQ